MMPLSQFAPRITASSSASDNPSSRDKRQAFPWLEDIVKAAWTVPAFTPARFALLALTAVAVTLGASGISAPHERAVNPEHSAMLRRSASVAEDFGTLTDTEFLIPAPLTHVPEHGSRSTPVPAPIVRRSYPPLAR